MTNSRSQQPAWRLGAGAAGMLVAAAVAATALYAARVGGQPVAGCSAPGDHLTVKDDASLQAALRCPSAKVISLLPGHYDRVLLSHHEALKLQSAVPADPAVLRALDIRDSGGIAVDNLTLAGRPDGLQYRLTVMNAHDVTLTRISIPGTPNTFDEPLFCAVMIRNSQKVTLSDYRVSWALNGVSFLDSSDVLIRRGVIHDIRSDSIHGGGTSKLTIEGNDISASHFAPGDHPDGIQLWTRLEKQSASDITIRDNLIERGTGSLTQGIFVNDEEGTLPFQNITIENNVLLGTMYHGIHFNHGSGTVSGNTLIAYPDMTTWIRVLHPVDVTVSNNVAPQYQLPSGVKANGNRTRTGSKSTAARAAADWRARHTD